jgi:Fe2+ or Zn2+ uptake regulation protein
MSCTQQLSEELHARGFRVTPQRHAIMHILKQAGGHISPAQVYQKARQIIPRLTEATVYRTLEFLSENGMVLPSLNGDGHLVYEIAGHDHHHLICRSCGGSMEFDHTLLQTLYRRLETKTGYQLITSHLTFFGMCPVCQGKIH